MNAQTSLPLERYMSEKQKSELFSRIYEDEKTGLLSFIKRRVDDADEAEDILQEVFIRLYNSLDLIDSLEKVVSWLFTVTRNRIIDSYRKKKPDRVDIKNLSGEGKDLSYNTADSALNNDVLWDYLSQSLEELPLEQKEAFVMHEIEGRSIKEIAELQEVSQNTVLSRKRYAILRLREMLEEVYQELKE